jgi:methanogen extracellular protein (TIGR04279 family)
MRFVFVVVLLFLLTATASASNIAVIKINNSENVTIANHTSDTSGNWILLTNGTSVRIPELTFSYSGITSANYIKNGKTINITSSVANYEVKYPFTTHRMYENNSNVTAVFYNSSDLTGNIDVYLSRTYPTQLRDIASNIIDGNTQPFKDLLDSSLDKDFNLSLDSTGMKEIDFGALSAGDYVIMVMLNESNPNNHTIISVTTFQVLEHTLTATAPSSVQQGDFIDIPLSLDASGTFTYGAFLIHNDSYKSTLRLKSNGTKAGTNLSADSEFLVDAFKVAGIGLNNVNKTTVQDIINGVIGQNNGTVVFKPGTSSSTSLSLTTENLKLGTYILTLGVWSNNAGERLVGFYQSEVEVTSAPTPTPTTTPSGGGGGGSAPSAPAINVPIDSATGKITSTTSLTTEGATLTIPEGTIVKDASGNPLSTPIMMLHTPTTAENIGAITAYELGPSGTTFNPPIDLVISYDPADIPEGFSESDIVIKMWDGTGWNTLETFVDTTAHTATAKVSHFSIFALFAEVKAAPSPPVTVTATPTATTMPTPTETPSPSKLRNLIPIVGIVMLALGIILAYFYIKRGKGE